MWVCAIAGLLAAAAKPHPFLAMVSPTTIAVGRGPPRSARHSLVLLSRGYLQPSFLDAQNRPPARRRRTGRHRQARSTEGKGDTSASSQRKANAALTLAASALSDSIGDRDGGIVRLCSRRAPHGEESRNVALTKEHGVNPRKEVLWEVAFLLPPLALAGRWRSSWATCRPCACGGTAC